MATFSAPHDFDRPSFEPLRQRLTLEVFHDEVVGPILVADVVERANMQVRQLRDGAGFAVEPFPELRIASESLKEDLDCDGTIKTCVTRFVDLPL